MKKNKLTKKQLQSNYQVLFEAADEVLLSTDNGTADDFWEALPELARTMESLSGQSFYKRWDRPTPAEDRLNIAKALGDTFKRVTKKHYGKNIN
jgi:hypothetical protein